MKISIEVLKCPDCGSYALSVEGIRVTGPDCKIWKVVPHLSFKVQRKDIIKPIYICPECGFEHYSYMTSSICCRRPGDTKIKT